MSIKERINYLIKHRFIRGAAMFQAANGVASVLQSLAGVVLARVLQPELFGQYSLAFSVAAVASIFLASGVQDALMPIIARKHSTSDGEGVLDGFAYWAKCIGISTVVVLVIVVALPSITLRLYGDAGIGILAGVILVASLVSSGLLSITQVSAQISGRIATLSWLTLGDMLARYGASVILTLVGLKALGASLGHLLGAIVVIGVSAFVFRRLGHSDPLLPSLRAIWSRAKTIFIQDHLAQSAWVWIDRNFGMLYQALPVAMVGLAVPVVSVAYFKLAFGYINTGLALLGPLSVLLNTEFARMQVRQPDRLIRNFIRVSLGGMLLGGIIAGGAALVGPWVFRVLYGSVYMAGAQLAYGLVVYGALFGLGIGLGPMWRAIGRVRLSVIINVLVMAVGLPIGFWLTHTYGAWGGIIMVTVWYAMAHIASFLYLLRHLQPSQP